LIRDVSESLNKNINFESAKNWVKKLKQIPEYLLELERKVSTGDNSKHVLDREVRLSYPPELEVEIVEWILFERQNEVPLNINDVKEFAVELIKTKCPKFKGSYNWIKKFLVRNNLSL